MEHFVLSNDERLGEIAARIKCKVSVSLVDCFSLAVGLLHHLPIYFMEESELDTHKISLIRNELDIDLHVLSKKKKK